ncbi:MAG TPA: aldolase/citrate lyase family protein [Oxalicibacterium sp.]|uniref:HpcH/HpaI aldolase family protein n=1 Tax=Oxalicibacterium sp. TaxID=2766525 RepID=UPI002C8E45D7|nr:aldolase/citrate lyase family protein [Oxalicibacterium sp.]HWU97131.1 aldolase/citrate lyase family protein [Oxalicibacterium sp.]
MKERISRGDYLYGLFCSTPAALTVELIAAAGYDFLVIDLEHALIGPEQLSFMLMASRASGIPALVRVAAPYQAQQALDNGAEGIVFPRIQSRRQAIEAVRSCHFAPLGSRGLNSTFHSGYGRDDLSVAVRDMSRDTLVIAMIEDLIGVENADEIAATVGVDILLEGAADLSQDLGVVWQTRHPLVQSGMAKVRQTTLKNGKIFCALPRAPEDFEAATSEGIRLFIVGDDRGIARRAMNAHLTQYREKRDET